MSLAATTIAEIQHGGSDTANGGTFNPAATLTADGAATSANTSSPVFTSASYNFVSADVGAWLFIKSGTNWTPGWYQIASVASNAATLTAGIGTAPLYGSGTGLPNVMNTVAGCATTASPTGASWTVDYSQQSSPIAITGAATSAGNTFILTSSATKAMIGNGLQITGGTNFTTGVYQITAVTAGSAITVDRNCATAAGSSGTLGVGGAFASPGFAGSLMQTSGMVAFCKYNASAYVATSASTNVAGGCLSMTAGTALFGYNTNRVPFNTDSSMPTFQIGGSVGAATLITSTVTTGWVGNVILDGNSQATSRGYNAGSAPSFAWRVQILNCTNGALIGGLLSCHYCSVSGCSSVNPITARCFFTEAYSNTVSPFSGNSITYACLAYNNTGASTDGFLNVAAALNCVAYNNGRDGFRFSTAASHSTMTNCIFEANAGWGANVTNGRGILMTCADYNNTSGRATGSNYADAGPITQSAGSYFTTPGSSIFSLNATAGQGALCRSTGFPATFPAGTTPNYGDVGAARHQDPTGASGMLYCPGMAGGMEA